MPSAPKKDRNYSRCNSCANQGHWARACEGCNDGNRYKIKPSLKTEKERVLGHKNNLQLCNNVTPPPQSCTSTTDKILQVLSLGFSMKSSEIAELVGAKENTVRSLLSKMLKNEKHPVNKSIGNNGTEKRGYYELDQDILIELDLLDYPLLFHNMRIYPEEVCNNFATFLQGEGVGFATLLQHLPDLHTTRGSANIWKYTFLQRNITFVKDHNSFYIEVECSKDPMNIKEVWQLTHWLSEKFGLDTYKFNWKMEYEVNQDIKPLNIIDGNCIEIRVLGQLHRAYQKTTGIVRVEAGRSKESSLGLLEKGRVASVETLKRAVENRATTIGMAERMEAITQKFEEINKITEVPEKLEKLMELEVNRAEAEIREMQKRARLEAQITALTERFDEVFPKEDPKKKGEKKELGYDPMFG